MSEKEISAKGTFLLCMVLLTASVTVGLAQPFPQLYDNFNAPNISRNKWLGGEGASGLGLETSRVTANGQLVLRTRSVGFTGSNDGSALNFVFLGLPDPQATGDMKATVTVTNVNDVGCSGNTTRTQSFAGLVGSFFNAGTPTNGDATDDVIAAMGIMSDSGRTAPRIVSYVLRCEDQSCDAFTMLHFNTFRPIALGTQATVQMAWDPQHHRFFFGESPFGRSDPDSFDYTGFLTDTSSPGLPFKHLQAQNNVANCTTVPRPVANISALYDNVNLAPTCQLPGTTCSSASDCCEGFCGPANTCQPIPTAS